jgi:N-acetylglucosamine kinase-like BadF-type ATPase
MLYLAIDAGGTKAEYVLADDLRELARTRSGTIKRMRTTAEIAREHLSGALRELEAAAGVSLQQVQRTCIGTAGNTVPLVTDFLRAELGERVGGELMLLGDVEIALDAAFPGSSGILVLAGTGSNVLGRAQDGWLTGAGGYGPALADQGSGHRIGEQALRALFLALDEGRPTSLLDAILAHWKLRDRDDLVAYANDCDLTQFSSLTPLVLGCANSGDAVAAEVLENEARQLASLALIVHRRLAQRDGNAWRPRFAFAGSILEHVLPVRRALLAELGRQLGSMEASDGVVDAVQGALWRARNAPQAGQA